MQKLIVTCECGQRMQVPRSAIGRSGMCPTCGATIAISTGNTTTATPKQRGRFFSARSFWGRGQAEPPEDAKRKFGEAVDLFYNQRYAEALAIFNALAQRFPGNPDIENGRQQCLSALKRPPALSLEHKGRTAGDTSALNEETVKKIVLEKMQSGATEAIQLHAAELAMRILGMDRAKPVSAATSAAPAVPEEPETTEDKTTAGDDGNGAPDGTLDMGKQSAPKPQAAEYTPRGLYDIREPK